MKAKDFETMNKYEKKDFKDKLRLRINNLNFSHLIDIYEYEQEIILAKKLNVDIYESTIIYCGYKFLQIFIKYGYTNNDLINKNFKVECRKDHPSFKKILLLLNNNVDLLFDNYESFYHLFKHTDIMKKVFAHLNPNTFTSRIIKSIVRINKDLIPILLEYQVDIKYIGEEAYIYAYKTKNKELLDLCEKKSINLSNKILIELYKTQLITFDELLQNKNFKLTEDLFKFGDKQKDLKIVSLFSKNEIKKYKLSYRNLSFSNNYEYIKYFYDLELIDIDFYAKCGLNTQSFEIINDVLSINPQIVYEHSKFNDFLTNLIIKFTNFLKLIKLLEIQLNYNNFYDFLRYCDENVDISINDINNKFKSCSAMVMYDIKTYVSIKNEKDIKYIFSSVLLVKKIIDYGYSIETFKQELYIYGDDSSIFPNVFDILYNLNVISGKPFVYTKDNKIYYPIVGLCYNGHTKIVSDILKNTTEDYNFNLGLVDACRADNLEMVNLLLNNLRVDPTYSDNYAILTACEKDHVVLVERLLHDVRINTIETFYKLFRICLIYGSVKTLELILNNLDNRKLYKLQEIYNKIEKNKQICIKSRYLNREYTERDIIRILQKYSITNKRIKYF